MDKISLTNTHFLLVLNAQSQSSLFYYQVWRAKVKPQGQDLFLDISWLLPFPLQSFNLPAAAKWLWQPLTHLISRWINSSEETEILLETLSGRLQFPKTVTILFVQGLIYKMEWFYSS